MTRFEEAVATPGEVGPLRRYRDELIAAGDPRARVVTGLIAALEGDGSQLEADDSPWGVALGLPVACALAADPGRLAGLAPVLRTTRMGVEMVDGPLQGRTRFFGDPDLPPALPWPVLADCRMWEALDEVDGGLPCRFVCQLDLRDFRGPGLPELEGLLSVFVFQEIDEVGSAGVVLHHFPEGTDLVRRPHPACDEVNQRLAPSGVTLRVVRMAPGRDGPWQSVLEEHEAAWDAAAEVLASHLYGMFGHLRGTTGADPTPGADFGRLLVVPCDEEGLLNVHLAIQEEALAAGRLTAFELVWVDFDGA